MIEMPDDWFVTVTLERSTSERVSICFCHGGRRPRRSPHDVRFVWIGEGTIPSPTAAIRPTR
jgi:hypothetical protein